MKEQLSALTPYVLFMFGIIVTYIGWSTKKILSNIEEKLSFFASKFEDHENELQELQLSVQRHDIEIRHLQSEVVEIKKSGKM